MNTVHYITEMVEVATGSVISRKLWTIKGAKAGIELLKSVPGTSKHCRGRYVSRVVKSWIA